MSLSKNNAIEVLACLLLVNLTSINSTNNITLNYNNNNENSIFITTKLLFHN